MGTRPAPELLSFCHLEEMLVLSGCGLFLGVCYIFKRINMEAKQIKVVKKWPKPKSI